MRCSECDSDNRQGRKFCAACGAPLIITCPKCGAENQPPERFCGECGTGLSETATRRREIAPITASNTGERRHLTVLFCDLVGSTEIAARLDPEEWREVVASYHRTATEAITQFGGYVAQYLGDGVMAYFGWPEAYDNNAERAVRAGLAIMDAMPDLNEESKVPTLHARVGIDSGAVVVGEGAARSAGVFGDAPNIAARVQAVAEPGGVLITDAVHRLISGLFVVQDRGTVQLKGIERPLQLYNVVGPSTVRGRLEATALSRGLTSFVGRDDELRLLRNRWERVLDGEGQVVLIVGEAGIGKSRLVRRFHEQMLGVAHTWVETSAAAFYQNTPFYLISEMSRGLAGCNRDQAPDKQLAQLVKALESAGVKPAEAIPLIAPLLSLPIPSTYPPPVLSPEQQRRRLFAILVEWVLGAAKGRPIVITTEDLHWADPSSLESIQLLMEQRAGARLLLICTARPEFRGQWPLQAHHTQVTLNRLSTQNVRSMVLQVVAHAALSDETLSAVVERTGGVPLFVEELTRAVLERGATKSVGREIPVTLHDSLMARLDRLGPAKEIMQLAAVIGSEFSYRLLHAVHPVADEDLRHDLRRLTDAELLYVRGIPPDATYQFKHALIRDAAYDALLKSRRRDLHRVVARTISEHFASLREAHPEVLARHWTEAGEAELAITEWSRAGKTVQARHAFNEARENYEQALALVDLLPESPERDLRELEIRQSIVQLLHLTKGYSAPDSIDATRRAVTLAQKSGNLRQLLNLLIAKGVNALSLGDLAAAGDLADQAMELALRDGASSSFFGRMRSLQMMVCYYRGDLAGVERHFTAGLKFFEDPSFRQVPGAGAITFGFASWNAWTLGRADSAREREAKMMAIANKDSPFEMAFLRFLVARMRIWAREYDEAESSAAGGVELSEEHRFPWLAALSRAALGHAMAKLGRASEGVTLIRQGMAGLVDTGSRFGVTNVIASLAEAYTCNGAVGDALEAAEKALQANPEEVVFRPCILQLRGELRLKQGLIDLAKSDLRDSIALSRKIGATAWELRATTSLSRLLASQKHQQEARSALAEIHNRITEGFDTADLKDARILLQELSILAF